MENNGDTRPRHFYTRARDLQHLHYLRQRDNISGPKGSTNNLLINAWPKKICRSELVKHGTLQDIAKLATAIPRNRRKRNFKRGPQKNKESSCGASCLLFPIPSICLHLPLLLMAALPQLEIFACRDGEGHRPWSPALRPRQPRLSFCAGRDHRPWCQRSATATKFAGGSRIRPRLGHGRDHSVRY